MSKMREADGEPPWPAAYLRADGVVRDLGEYIPEQWPHPGGRQSWHGCRADVARWLGRKVLPEISGMTGNW